VRLFKSSTGATITSPEVQGEQVTLEAGQILDEVEQAQAEIAIEAGESMLVTNDHWTDKLSYEMKGFANKLEAFGSKIKAKGLKAEYDELMEEFKEAATKEREDGPSSSTDIATDKHERMVATKGQNVHLAATTQGASVLEADAEMAKAMGQLEGKQAEQIRSNIMAQFELLKTTMHKQEAAHKSEVTSKVKDASEKATAAAEARHTRNRADKADKAAADVAKVAAQFSPADTAGSGDTLPASPIAAPLSLSKEAAGGMLGKQLAAMGLAVEAGKSSKSTKRKADGEPVTGETGNGLVDSAGKAKAKVAKVNPATGEPWTKKEEEQERRDRAKECFEKLGIRGPAGLEPIVKELTSLRKQDGTIKALKEKLARREEQKLESQAERKKLAKRVRKAIAILTESEWTKEDFVEAGLVSGDEEEEEEE